MSFDWLRTRNKTSHCAPPDTRVYAIGDIHGRADLLTALLRTIDRDSDGYIGRRVLVFLGDYVDRGLHSREVLDLLTGTSFAGYETFFLKGNHDAWLLQSLADPAHVHSWLASGGLATLLSYGIDVPAGVSGEQRASLVQQGLQNALPESHQRFLAQLRTLHIEGSYLFVHAGIRPGVPLEEQREEDLCWIRDEFLNDSRDHGYCVVHGHSISGKAQRRKNRIGVDTGAYATGCLSCLVVEGHEQRFLRT